MGFMCSSADCTFKQSDQQLYLGLLKRFERGSDKRVLQAF